MRRVQGLQIMTQTSSSVTSRLDSMFDGPAAPVTTSRHPPQSSHGSPVECLMAPYRPHSLSEASGWMEERGESATKVKKDESWRRWTGLMMTMDSRPSGLSLFKQTSATSLNIPCGWHWRLAGFLSSVVRIQNRANMDCMSHSRIRKHIFIHSLYILCHLCHLCPIHQICNNPHTKYENIHFLSGCTCSDTKYKIRKKINAWKQLEKKQFHWITSWNAIFSCPNWNSNKTAKMKFRNELFFCLCMQPCYHKLFSGRRRRKQWITWYILYLWYILYCIT